MGEDWKAKQAYEMRMEGRYGREGDQGLRGKQRYKE